MMEDKQQEYQKSHVIDEQQQYYYDTLQQQKDTEEGISDSVSIDSNNVEIDPQMNEEQSAIESEMKVDSDIGKKTTYFPACFPNRDLPNIIVFILVILFGLSSWIVINGLYTALPIFMAKLPEKYEFPASMNLALQLANVFPFLFFIFSCLIPWKRVRFHIDTVTIMCLIVVGMVACILMTFLWDHTSNIGGKQMSFAFLCLIFITGAVDCTSSVIYWPFISNYKYYYTTALAIGEGLTGLITGIIGLIMQPGEKPIFSFPVFAGILTIILAVSGAAFCILRFVPYCRNQMVNEEDFKQPQTTEEIIPLTAEEKKKELRNLKWNKALYSIRLILIQSVTSFVQNGILVSIGPYIFHAYPKSADLLRYSILLTLIFDPIFCFLAYFVPFYNWMIACFVHFVWFTLAVFQFAVALKNPHSPRAGSLGMGIGLVVITILTRMFQSFGKTAEWLLVHKQMKLWAQMQSRLDSTEEKKRKYIHRIELSPFRLAGVGIQVGALAGAIMMILFTKYKIVKDGY
jgi:riboflavin transporter 2